MWILTCPGPSLQGKSRWLRPGKTYTIGRSSSAEIQVEGKSVSRTHAQIIVGPVPDGASSHLSIKSQLSVRDLNTKFGTLFNGTKMDAGATEDVTAGSTMINIGKSLQPQTSFVITWKSVIMTYSVGDNQDVLPSIRQHLEPLDIKLLPEFHPLTTHLIKSCANSSKVLYALVRNIPIVSLDYAEAVFSVSDSLEHDYTSFPDPALYRASPKFTENPARSSMFDGMVFVFGEQKQRLALSTVVTAGGGKSLLYEVSNDSTAQSLGEFITSSTTSKRTVLVKYPTPASAPTPDELAHLVTMNDAARLLNIDLIDPVELLDIILNGDATPLIRQFPHTEEPSATSASLGNSFLQKSISHNPTTQRSKIRRRPQHQVDIFSMMATQSESPSQTLSQSQSSSVTPSVDVKSEPKSDPKAKGVLGRKRVHRVAFDFMDPVGISSEPKKSRADNVVSSEPQKTSSPMFESSEETPAEFQNSVPLLDIDNGSQVLLQEEGNGDPQNKESEDDFDISELRNLAVVERTFPVRRKPLQFQATEVSGTGVPNFKGFRKAGRGTTVELKPHKVSLIGRGSHNAAGQEAEHMFGTKRPPTALPRAARPKTKRPKVADADESLFVDSDSADEAFSLAPPTVQSSRTLSAAHDSDDEFTFRFTS